MVCSVHIDVIFQNQDFIVVNKPPGLGFHCESQMPGLVALIKQQQKLLELYPVHRLDKMTSGLVLFALNLSTAQQFQCLFSQHDIQKYYLAISNKKPKKKQGWIIGDMVPARRGSWKLTNTRNRPAKTYMMSALIKPKQRLYLIKPVTGKTHQIRVALKSIGAPILGDIRYADSNQARQVDRGYLHAFALRFTLLGVVYQFVQPPTGQAFLTLECQAIIKRWQEPWCCI